MKFTIKENFVYGWLTAITVGLAFYLFIAYVIRVNNVQTMHCPKGYQVRINPMALGLTGRCDLK